MEPSQPIKTRLSRSSIDSGTNDELMHIDDGDTLMILNGYLRGRMKQILLTLDGRGGAARGIQDWALPGNIEKAIAAISIEKGRWRRDDCSLRLDSHSGVCGVEIASVMFDEGFCEDGRRVAGGVVELAG